VLATADGVGIVEIMRTAAGVSKTAVWRWQARFMDEGVEGLLPKFAAKVRDIVGLYVDPPAHSVVLSVDEKSQIQALDRTQPGLPMKKGRAGTMTHDYKRHGTTTLFAAFDILEGNVIGRCTQRHRHQEFIRFLNAVEGFFAMLTRRRLKRGVFKGVVDLRAAINRFVVDYNLRSKPFVWTADPDKIIAAAARGHQVLESIR
jgi:hypothetical protein